MTRFIMIMVLFVLPISGCAQPMVKMQAVFEDWVQKTVGHSLEQLQDRHVFYFIGERTPTEIRELENGNLLYVYNEYWQQIGVDRVPCDVFLEFDSKTMRVVKARSSGDGCFTAY